MEWSNGIDLPSLQFVTVGSACFANAKSVSFVSNHLSLFFMFRPPFPH